MIRLAARLLVVLPLLALAACTAGDEPPTLGPLALASAETIEGRRVFMRFCNQCHPGGETGLGPTLNDIPAPGWLIKLQVRNGFGAMPAFDEGVIPPEALDSLVAYLKVLRRAS